MSFVYNEDERQCHLLDAAADSQIHLLPSDHHDYYLLRSEAGAYARARARVCVCVCVCKCLCLGCIRVRARVFMCV